jgi:transcriptional regulator with PAS, ATPase and Fis domain
VAATNQHLAAMVDAGAFRRDLYYRFKVIRLEMPPLRRRMEDIPLLVEHFIDRLNRLRGKTISGMDQEALEILMTHRFPGNIRELENIIEYAFVLCAGSRISVRHLPADLLHPEPAGRGDQAPFDPVKTAEIRVINEALGRNQYNRQAAARELGIHKSTLFRKIQRLDIRLPDRDGRTRS